jgi:nucleoside-diphosphate-sugar epimerase
MTLLITGIHGFVGTNLVEHLKSNHKIYGLDIVSPEKEGVIKTFSWDDIDDAGGCLKSHSFVLEG